jgi:modulator of FtsH protease HflC
MQNKLIVAVASIFLSVVVISNFVFIVKETERAVMLKFGEVTQADIKPGIHFKVPIMNKVRKFDGRLLTSDASPRRYLTKEKKAVIVDSYAQWRIVDVQLFYTKTSGDLKVASSLLASRIDTGLRNQFGERTLREVVSGERDQLMTELTTSLNKATRKALGIEVLDVRVKGIDLPPEVSESVFSRMSTERERQAKELRSQGKEIAEGIKADADKQKVIITANAYREAQEIKGEGDASAASIYAESFNKDPDFYSFYRSLDAYKKSFADKDDLLVLDPNSEFFSYLIKGLNN